MEPLAPGDPTSLGRYQLVGRLGTGGMGRVYLGRPAAGPLAAVKVVHPALLADPEFRTRFQREIDTARRARAPWTAAMLDADPTAATPWLATEYVAGATLGETIAATGPLPEQALLRLAAQLAEALQGLHAAGVVHRDLKPSNVLLAPDGPRLIDFGIATAVDATRITTTGAVVGTPAYMSPEQALGDPTGPPADVFSLAAVLVFAATGAGPFGSTTNALAMLRRVIDAEPDLDGVPTALRQHLQPCLAKDPALRPTADDLRGRLAAAAAAAAATWLSPAALTYVIARGPDPAPPPPPLVPPARRRSPAVTWGVGAVATVLVLGSLMNWVWPDRPARAPVTAAPSAPAAATPSAEPVPSRPAGLDIPAVVPGWRVAGSTSRNAAYDVPPSWTPASPTVLRGYEDEQGPVALMTGIAELRTPPCPGGDPTAVPAWTGVSGTSSPDRAQATRDAVAVWTDYYSSEQEKARSRTRQLPKVTVNGQSASHVVADVEVTRADSCGIRQAVIHVVATAGGPGQTLLWVLLAGRGSVPDADIDRMIGSLRTAGMPEQCRVPLVAGNWC